MTNQNTKVEAGPLTFAQLETTMLDLAVHLTDLRHHVPTYEEAVWAKQVMQRAVLSAKEGG